MINAFGPCLDVCGDHGGGSDCRQKSDMAAVRLTRGIVAAPVQNEWSHRREVLATDD